MDAEEICRVSVDMLSSLSGDCLLDSASPSHHDEISSSAALARRRWPTCRLLEWREPVKVKRGGEVARVGGDDGDGVEIKREKDRVVSNTRIAWHLIGPAAGTTATFAEDQPPAMSSTTTTVSNTVDLRILCRRLIDILDQ